jgi:tRNA (cmo5U34)-methyltransferase
MTTAPFNYRWNAAELAAAYDQAAEVVHPHYREIQDVILGMIGPRDGERFLLVDAGGGSGRLAERVLQRFGHARTVILDQSEPFLGLARERLRPFGDRTAFVLKRLQDDWVRELPQAPTYIVSMSAIHHLDPAEKRALYARCFRALRPGGMLINGDEVRAAEDAQYLAQCQRWAAHMQRVMDEGLVPEPLCQALRGWIERNVDRFDQPRKSGDDCHETIAAQRGYLAECGFVDVGTTWQKDMWAVLHGTRP